MQRKLTVILSADVVGYSALMQRDEAGTLMRLKQNRAALFDPRVAAHGGRTFKLMGDGVLVEFSSAAAAVDCAIEIQAAMAAQAAGAAEPLRYRIGINLGDVIVDGEDIYGDGVNVAARLQTLAPAGGISVSRNVADQVAGKVAADFDDLGPHTVKPDEAPVHVFAVRPRAAASAAAERTAASICVLPFANMSGDAEQEYFSDGISEDIITDLSKVSALHVVSRNTAFTFKGRSVEVGKVAQQLKVTHVLEGSVRKAGGRVRITAQLIDGASDGHVWAERYDRDLDDIFAIQDEISQAIVKALKLKLLPEEKQAIERRDTSNTDAYNLFLMARQYMVTGNLGDGRRSEAIIRLCRRATEIDPSYARAWALMAVAQVHLRFFAGGASGDDGLEAAERAIALDPDLAEAHAAKGVVLTFRAEYDEAQKEIDAALRLEPDSFEANVAAARQYYSLRELEKAALHLEKAAAAAETDFWSVGMLIAVYRALGHADRQRSAALRTLERTQPIFAQDPNNGSAMAYAVSAHATLGDEARARELMDRAMLLDPNNANMRYNFVCATIRFNDLDRALDMLEPLLGELISQSLLNWSKSDPAFDPIRNHPRFVAMMERAEGRLAARA